LGGHRDAGPGPAHRRRHWSACRDEAYAPKAGHCYGTAHCCHRHRRPGTRDAGPLVRMDRHSWAPSAAIRPSGPTRSRRLASERGLAVLGPRWPDLEPAVPRPEPDPRVAPRETEPAVGPGFVPVRRGPGTESERLQRKRQTQKEPGQKAERPGRPTMQHGPGRARRHRRPAASGPSRSRGKTHEAGASASRSLTAQPHRTTFPSTP
jgi:hypothetical protein